LPPPPHAASMSMAAEDAASCAPFRIRLAFIIPVLSALRTGSLEGWRCPRIPLPGEKPAVGIFRASSPVIRPVSTGLINRPLAGGGNSVADGRTDCADNLDGGRRCSAWIVQRGSSLLAGRPVRYGVPVPGRACMDGSAQNGVGASRGVDWA